MISLSEQAVVSEHERSSLVVISVTAVFMHIAWTLLWAAMILSFWAATGCGAGGDDEREPAARGKPRLDLRVVAASYATSAEGIARIGPGEVLKDPSGRAWHVTARMTFAGRTSGSYSTLGPTW